jgi:hypothetical protein
MEFYELAEDVETYLDPKGGFSLLTSWTDEERLEVIEKIGVI